jgi:hypothetical protein
MYLAGVVRGQFPAAANATSTATQTTTTATARPTVFTGAASVMQAGGAMLVMGLAAALI